VRGHGDKAKTSTIACSRGSCKSTGRSNELDMDIRRNMYGVGWPKRLSALADPGGRRPIECDGVASFFGLVSKIYTL
jgi:hypothetical protein